MYYILYASGFDKGLKSHVGIMNLPEAHFEFEYSCDHDMLADLMTLLSLDNYASYSYLVHFCTVGALRHVKNVVGPLIILPEFIIYNFDSASEIRTSSHSARICRNVPLRTIAHTCTSTGSALAARSYNTWIIARMHKPCEEHFLLTKSQKPAQLALEESAIYTRSSFATKSHSLWKR